MCCSGCVETRSFPHATTIAGGPPGTRGQSWSSTTTRGRPSAGCHADGFASACGGTRNDLMPTQSRAKPSAWHPAKDRASWKIDSGSVYWYTLAEVRFHTNPKRKQGSSRLPRLRFGLVSARMAGVSDYASTIYISSVIDPDQGWRYRPGATLLRSSVPLPPVLSAPYLQSQSVFSPRGTYPSRPFRADSMHESGQHAPGPRGRHLRRRFHGRASRMRRDSGQGTVTTPARTTLPPPGPPVFRWYSQK
jgi:hypothetical protein